MREMLQRYQGVHQLHRNVYNFMRIDAKKILIKAKEVALEEAGLTETEYRRIRNKRNIHDDLTIMVIKI